MRREILQHHPLHLQLTNWNMKEERDCHNMMTVPLATSSQFKHEAIAGKRFSNMHLGGFMSSSQNSIPHASQIAISSQIGA